MANYFDKYDPPKTQAQPQAKASAGNYFDRYDADAAPQPEPQDKGSEFWEGAANVMGPGVLGSLARIMATPAATQLRSGAVEGVAALPGLPADLIGLELKGLDYLAGNETPTENPVEFAGGATFRDMARTALPLADEPTTTEGKYARAIGEFAGPSVLTGAGLLSWAQRAKRAGAAGKVLTAIADNPATFMTGETAAGTLGGAGSETGAQLDPENPYARVIGGLAGGLTPAVVGVGARALNGLGSALRYSTAGGREAAAAERLASTVATPGTVPELEAAPLNMPVTLGQATNDPGLLSFEKGLSTAPENVGAFGNLRSQQNEAIRDAFEQLQTGAGTGTPAQVREALTELQRAARTAEKAAWKPINESTTPVQLGALNDEIRSFVGGLTTARRSFIPQEISDLIEQVTKSPRPFVEVSDLRSAIGNATRQARAQNNFNQANVLEGLGGAVDKFIDNIPIAEGGTTARWEAAREVSRKYAETFKNNPTVRRLLGRDAFGGDRVAVSDTLDTILAAGPEAANSVMKAMAFHTTGQNALRRLLVDRIFKAAETNSASTAGLVLSPAKLRQFLKSNGDAIGAILTPEQRTRIDEIQKALDVAERTAKAGPRGAPMTATALQTERMLDRAASFMIPIPGTRMHVSLGGVVRRQRSQVNDLLKEAVLTPQIGRALLMRNMQRNGRLLNMRTVSELRPYSFLLPLAENDRGPVMYTRHYPEAPGGYPYTVGGTE